MSELTERLRHAAKFGGHYEDAANRIGELETEITILTKQNEILDEALEKLSKLGNGDRLGHSHGNMIAQQALQSANELGDD